MDMIGLLMCIVIFRGQIHEGYTSCIELELVNALLLMPPKVAPMYTVYTWRCIQKIAAQGAC